MFKTYLVYDMSGNSRRVFKFGKFAICKEFPGMISVNPCWVCTYDWYLHVEDSLFGLLWNVFTEYKHDRHLAG